MGFLSLRSSEPLEGLAQSRRGSPMEEWQTQTVAKSELLDSDIDPIPQIT